MQNFLSKLSREAGQILRKYHKSSHLIVEDKSDGSPVTQADREVSDFLVEALSKQGVPVISEESDFFPETAPEKFFIIDPIDGTKYFARGDDSFVICLGYIEFNKPVKGAIYEPVGDRFFYAEKNKGCSLNGQKLNSLSSTPKYKAFSNGFHRYKKSQWLIEQLQLKQIDELGSALKFAEIALGNYDFYPRFGKSYEWDTAAGQILCEEVGASVLDMQTLKPLTYGKKDFLNQGFIALRQDWEEKVIEIFKIINEERRSNEPRD